MTSGSENTNVEASHQIGLLYGDKAKLALRDDEFGLDRIASSVADMLSDRIVADGYTIGIEGEWGSGKTSLTNFIVEKINEKQSLTLKIYRFDPWLVGHRDSLIGEFFNGLKARIAEFRGDPLLVAKIRSEDKGLLDRLIASIERYQKLLNDAGSIVASGPTHHFKMLGLAIKGVGWLLRLFNIKFKAKPHTLAAARDEIRANLNALAKLSPSTRFIVMIDDLDRLDPEESIEILRLVRAVADFPLVTYLLCFDRSSLAKQVRAVIRVGNGHDYLEKIFQGIISLPPQEAFAIRRFARKLLAEKFPKEFVLADASSRDRAEREMLFFDRWAGKFIHTPRHAVRFAEAVTLGWPEIEGRADFIDYAWLQLIKLQCNDLYQWVREYVVTIGSFRDGGRPGDTEPQEFANRLLSILNKSGLPTNADFVGMQSFLPGMSSYLNKEKPSVLKPAKGELAEFEKGRRLGSPSHWRQYFAFDNPSYALDNEVFTEFRRAAAAKNIARGAQIILELLARPHVKSGHYLEVFLDRLFDIKDQLRPEELAGIAKIFGDTMDEVPLRPASQFETITIWRRAETFLDASAAPEFPETCKNGRALNWLTDAIRTQGFAHGRVEQNRERTELQWLPAKLFDKALSAILDRLMSVGVEGILNLPQPLTALYCWLQLGDAEMLGAMIRSFISSDEGLVRFLDGCRTWYLGSDGPRKGLQSENVSPFVDASSAHHRITLIAQGDGNESRLANEILQSWSQ